jgi:threonine/homoserine/homoserine lactone efflux protein
VRAVIWSGVAWTSFAPTALLISLLPGANQLLIVRNAVRQGSGDALAGLAGRLGGFAVLILIVAVGVGSVLTTSPVAFGVMNWLAVAYLTWVGVGALRNANPTAHGFSEMQRTRRSLARQEFFVALTNPKALLLFAVILPQFIADGHQATGQLLLVGIAYLAVEAMVGAGYALLGGRLRVLTTGAVRDGRLDRISGLLFLGLAVYLALDVRA